jgi:hypothetical protein
MSSSQCSVAQKDFEILKEASLKETFNDKSFTDVTLVCNDDKHVAAHRIILSAQSLFFNKIFKVNDKRDILIYLPNISSEELKHILAFIYLGQTDISETDLEKFMIFGKLFEIKGLLELPPIGDSTNTRKIKEEGFEDESLLISKSLLKRQPNGKFPCDQCEYQSVFRRGVRRHQEAVHLGIKHACDACPKEYADLNDLRMHKKNAHEGVSYQCDQCNKAYSVHKNLLKHERDHQGINTSCNICEKSFITSNALSHHVRKQHDGYRYICNFCDFKAKRKFNLKEHIGTVHASLEMSNKI